MIVPVPPVTLEVNVAPVPSQAEAGPLAETLVGAWSRAKATPLEVTLPHTLLACTV